MLTVTLFVALKIFLTSSALILGFSVKSTTADFDQSIVKAEKWKSDNLVKHIVSIRKKFSNFHFCAGSILNDYFILTAAHCLYDNNKSIYNVRQIEVVAGVTYRLRTQMSMQTRDVSTIIPHEKFGNNFADIGLMKLNAALEENNRTVQRVFLNYNVPDTSLWYIAYGWGKWDERGPLANKIQYVLLTVEEDEVCFQKPYFMPLGDICSIANGSGTCYGDSGGPLFTTARPYLLTGVISYGSKPCGTVSFFTSIYFYQEWIESTDDKICAYIMSSLIAFLHCRFIYNGLSNSTKETSIIYTEGKRFEGYKLI